MKKNSLIENRRFINDSAGNKKMLKTVYRNESQFIFLLLERKIEGNVYSACNEAMIRN
jgi:hypothetical protein